LNYVVGLVKATATSNFFLEFENAIETVLSKYFENLSDNQKMYITDIKEPSKVKYILIQEIKPKVEISSWSISDSRPIKVNVGSLSKSTFIVDDDELDIVFLPIELECAGLQPKSIQLNFISDNTMIITGEKFRMDENGNNQSIIMSHIFKTRFSIAKTQEGARRTTKSVRINRNLNVEIHVFLNANAADFPEAHHIPRPVVNKAAWEKKRQTIITSHQKRMVEFKDNSKVDLAFEILSQELEAKEAESQSDKEDQEEEKASDNDSDQEDVPKEKISNNQDIHN